MGTMRQRSPGKWELEVSAGRDACTGKHRRVIRTVQTTSKREAKAALAALETEVRAGSSGSYLRARPDAGCPRGPTRNPRGQGDEDPLHPNGDPR